MNTRCSRYSAAPDKDRLKIHVMTRAFPDRFYIEFCKAAYFREPSMELILDGTSEIGAHVWSELDYLIFVEHLFR